MALINPRARVTLQLLPPPSVLPLYRSDFNPDTHHIFSSEVVLAGSKTRHSTSVSVPKSLLTGDITLDKPLHVEGPLAMHLVEGEALEFQIDVDRLSAQAEPALTGHLHVELQPEPGNNAIPSSQDYETWVVEQVFPTKEQFWLHHHPIDVIVQPGFYKWFHLSACWSTKEVPQLATPSVIADLCLTDCRLPQAISHAMIGADHAIKERTVALVQPHVFADTLRHVENMRRGGPSTAIDPVALSATIASTPRIAQEGPIPSASPDPATSNEEVEAAFPTPEDGAGANVDPVIPQPPLRQHAPRRATSHRSTSRQALNLHLKGHKLERVLKQLGAEHTSEHVAALLATTKPGSTTRSKHRVHEEFSTGPLVGTRAQRRHAATPA